MKKIVILLLALALTACAAPATEQPTAAPPEPTATPVVVVQTVIVEASPAPTDVPPPTAVPPTAVPPTAVPPVVVTVVVEATQASVQPTAAQASGGDAPIALDNALGRGVFVNMTMSSNSFTLRCFPRDITFNITANNLDITDTLLYYRMVDLKRLYPSEWKNFGKMVKNGGGNFSLTFTGENVHPDLRLDQGWFDFQFVGLNKAGTVVDRTEGIESLVTYSIDCP